MHLYRLGELNLVLLKVLPVHRLRRENLELQLCREYVP